MSLTTLTNPTGGGTEDLRESPLEFVRTLTVLFIQGLFAEAPSGFYHWSEDPNVTELSVIDDTVISGPMDKRPCILCTRGPMQMAPVGQGDIASWDARTGLQIKEVMLPGTISINCVSRVSLECDRLAWIIAEQLWANRDLVMQAGFFDIGRNIAISAPSPAGALVAGDDGHEAYATVVTVPFQITRRTYITPLGKKIVKNLSFSLDNRLARLRKQGVPTGLSVQQVGPPPFASTSDSGGRTPSAAGCQEDHLPRLRPAGNPAGSTIVTPIYGNATAPATPPIGVVPIPQAQVCVPESPTPAPPTPPAAGSEGQ